MSSSDDLPIEDIAARARTAASPAGSDSPVPDWISQYHSPAAARASPPTNSAESDDLIIVSTKPGDRKDTDLFAEPPVQGRVSEPEEPNTAQTKAGKQQRSGAKSAKDSAKKLAGKMNLTKPPGKISSARPGTKADNLSGAIPTVATTLQKSGIQPATAPSAELVTAATTSSSIEGVAVAILTQLS